MTKSAQLLDLAIWLEGAGLGRSAAGLLHAASGRVVNSLKERASSAALPAGIYGLMVYEGRGIVVPVTLEMTPSRLDEAPHVEALGKARRWVSQRFDADLPAFRVRVEELIFPDGESLGLAAVLAAVSHFTGVQPALPVLVTGTVLDDGTVGPVAGLDEKWKASDRELAERELAGCHSLRIVPKPGARQRIEDIVELVFGPLAGLRVDLDRHGRPAQLERARKQRDHETARWQLEALLDQSEAPADRFDVLLELGNRLRHLGHTAEAQQRHDEALRQLNETRAIEYERQVDLEIQRCATSLDGFRLVEAETGLRNIRARELRRLSVGNEIQLRGTLAQVLATQGRFAEAIEERLPNVDLHRQRADYRIDLPRTLSNLVLDAARLGETGRFETWVEELFSGQRSEVQLTYAFAALLRGLSFLKRWDELLAVFENGTYLQHRLPPSLASLANAASPVTSHPEVSVARAVARALRQTGRQTEAIGLAQRVQGTPGLINWLGLLAQGERALALRASGDEAQANAVLADLRRALPLAEPAATAHHAALLTCGWPDLEAELEAPWY